MVLSCGLERDCELQTCESTVRVPVARWLHIQLALVVLVLRG